MTFPLLEKEDGNQVQEAYRTPHMLNQKRKSPEYIIIKILNVQKKENIESCKEKRPSNI